MLPYEKTILVYGATGLRRTDVENTEDFDNLALFLENSIDYKIGESMCKLAIFYEHGCAQIGIQTDEDKATYWYGRAAKVGNIEAMYYYGNRLVAHSNQGENAELQNLGFTYMKKAADSDFPRALFMVGLAYKTGIMGERDEAKALFYLRKAAKAGETEAHELIDEIMGI